MSVGAVNQLAMVVAVIGLGICIGLMGVAVALARIERAIRASHRTPCRVEVRARAGDDDG